MTPWPQAASTHPAKPRHPISEELVTMLPQSHALVSALRPHFLKAAIIAFAVAPMLAGGGCSYMNKPTAKATKSATAPHVAGSALTVDTRNGSVEVVAGGSDGGDGGGEVRIDATIVCEGDTQQQADERLAQAGLEIARDSSTTLFIKPTFPGEPRGSDGASFVIHLPDASGVNIVTSNGMVTVTSCGGTLGVQTSNGPVEVTDHSGPAVIKTSNGSITIRNLAGDLHAKTSNGGVDASGVKGKATIDTANGAIDLELDAGAAGPVMLDSSNAPIRVTVGKAFKGDVSLNTSNGTLRIAGDGVQTEQKDKTAATMRMGGGEKSVIKTSNGNIDFTVN